MERRVFGVCQVHKAPECQLTGLSQLAGGIMHKWLMARVGIFQVFTTDGWTYFTNWPLVLMRGGGCAGSSQPSWASSI
jgi:hypothetical protein